MNILETVRLALLQIWAQKLKSFFTLLGVILFVGLAVAVTGFVVFVERGQRRIPIQHARRVVGRRVTQGGMSYFPLRVNTAGVIPAIFASSLLMFPLTIGQFTDSPGVQNFIDRYMNPASVPYQFIYIGLIIFFCYFYVSIIFNPQDTAENMRKYGGFIPGIRSGRRTAEYIDRILTRLTLVGSLYLACVSIIPELLLFGFKMAIQLGPDNPAVLVNRSSGELGIITRSDLIGTLGA